MTKVSDHEGLPALAESPEQIIYNHPPADERARSMTLRDAFYAGLRYEAPLEAEDFTYIDIQVDPKDIS